MSLREISRRTAFLGEALSRDCDIAWIKSGFSHDKKRNLHGDGVRCLNKHFKIIHVPGIGYKHNVCFRRYLHDWVCARQMLPVLKSVGSIDAIVCSNQNVGASYLASRFAKKRCIPFLLDLRDPWPDAFPYAVSNRFLHLLLKLAIKPDQFLLKKSLENASAIVSMSEDMLNWGLRKVTSEQKPTRVFYLSTVRDVTLTQQQTTAFSQKYANLLARKTFKCFYISRWGVNFQPSLLVELARQMQFEAVDFILCGDGDYGDEVRRKAASLPNVFCPGFLPHEEAYFLAKHCHCGIVFSSNESLEQFTKVTPTFPNKAFFHFMCGLPLLNGMPGELATVISQHHIGFNFQKNDLRELQRLILLLKADEKWRRTAATISRFFFEQYGNPEKVYAGYARFVKGFCKKMTPVSP